MDSTSAGRVVDDPARDPDRTATRDGTNDLPADEMPRDDDDDETGFGQKADYWREYNRVTDKHDGDLMQRLNSNLDNTLIFVSAACPMKHLLKWLNDDVTRLVYSPQSTPPSSSRRWAP